MSEYDRIASRSPQYRQQDQMPGIVKAQVVDVRDPSMMGRVRALAYGIHGDYQDLDIEAIQWADCAIGGRGAFMPPQLGDRVLLSFDAGDKYAPLVTGYWTATPMGDGKLPWNKWKGSEIRPEVWHHHDLYPEGLMLASSGLGNAIWILDIVMNRSNDEREANIASSINIMDTGGKYIRSKSFFMGKPDYSPVEEFIDSEQDNQTKGSLYKKDFGEYQRLRTGFEATHEIDPVPGAIELGHQHLKRDMLSDESTFTLDRLTQKLDETEVSHEVQSIGGTIWNTRVKQAQLSILESTIMLNAPQVVMISDLLTVPRRWD